MFVVDGTAQRNREQAGEELAIVYRQRTSRSRPTERGNDLVRQHLGRLEIGRSGSLRRIGHVVDLGCVPIDDRRVTRHLRQHRDQDTGVRLQEMGAQDVKVWGAIRERRGFSGSGHGFEYRRIWARTAPSLSTERETNHRRGRWRAYSAVHAFRRPCRRHRPGP
nr:hypothetical protein [Mycolicibacterium peregrinum]